MCMHRYTLKPSRYAPPCSQNPSNTAVCIRGFLPRHAGLKKTHEYNNDDLIMVRPRLLVEPHPGAPPAADLERFCRALDAAPKLSDASKLQYKTMLRRLTDVLGHDVHWILANCSEAKALLLAVKRTDGKTMLEVPQTLKAMLMPVLAILRHVPDMATAFPGAHACWSDLNNDVVSPLADERYETNEPSERQVAAYVPWADILEKRDQLLRSAPTSVAALLLSLYSMIPPARADYGRVRVYSPPSDPVPGVAIVPNHIVWTKSANTMHLVLDEFKTRSKKGGAHEADLPLELVAVIARSLLDTPRKWLVVPPLSLSGEPFATNAAYAKYVARTLAIAFGGKPVTLNALRHSFSSSLDFNQLSPRDRKAIADALMHSPEMTHRYRYRFATPGAPPNAQCQLVCKKKTAAPAASPVGAAVAAASPVKASAKPARKG